MTPRLIIAVGFALGFYTVTLSAIKSTERLTGSSPVIIFRTGTAEQKISVTLLFVFPLLVIASALFPDGLLARPVFDARPLPFVGTVLMIGGLRLHFVSLRTLGAAFQIGVDPSKTPGIVRTGPYRLVRHPVYTALLLYFLAAWLLMPNLLFTIAMPLAALRVYLQARYEEAALLEKFGSEYAAYMRSTARFLPGVL